MSEGSEQPAGLFDRNLAGLPDGARRREWMGRVEAVIFAARDPLPREALNRAGIAGGHLV
ncbi:hypothetical protein IY145_01930 [Methylosinus sp. H3A]|uniref:hypothetical protein n=1 Tax=Methylosinus sp. H3A TaxID=2785786 RepID=UPI0018C22AA0|nr:hypothetical protein [Methylosinus sp. H3A]MBG0808171.1 hypothetical protein [Methylosinus sp. H3A]